MPLPVEERKRLLNQYTRVDKPAKEEEAEARRGLSSRALETFGISTDWVPELFPHGFADPETARQVKEAPLWQVPFIRGSEDIRRSGMYGVERPISNIFARFLPAPKQESIEAAEGIFTGDVTPWEGLTEISEQFGERPVGEQLALGAATFYVPLFPGGSAAISGVKAAPGAARMAARLGPRIAETAREPFERSTTAMTRRSMPTGEFVTPQGEMVTRPGGVPGVSMTEPIFESPFEEVMRRGPGVLADVPFARLGESVREGVQGGIRRIARRDTDRASQVADEYDPIWGSGRNPLFDLREVIPLGPGKLDRRAFRLKPPPESAWAEAQRIAEESGETLGRKGRDRFGNMIGMDIIDPELTNIQRLLTKIIPDQGRRIGELIEVKGGINAARIAKQAIDDRSATVTARTMARINGAFRFDKEGRIPSLANIETKVNAEGQLEVPGAPTIQDVAARFDVYIGSGKVTPEQREVLQSLQEEVLAYQQAMKQFDIDYNIRGDITPGGFYLHRGSVQGKEDLPISGNRTRKAKPGALQEATYDSMAQAIAAGERYTPLRDSISRFTKDVGYKLVDDLVATHFKGLQGVETRGFTIDKVLKAKIDGLKSHIRNRKKHRDVMAAILKRQVQSARRAGQLLDRTDARLGARLRNLDVLTERMTDEDILDLRKEASKAITQARRMQASVSENLGRLQEAEIVDRREWRNLAKKRDELDAAIKDLEEVQGLEYLNRPRPRADARAFFAREYPDLSAEELEVLVRANTPQEFVGAQAAVGGARMRTLPLSEVIVHLKTSVDELHERLDAMTRGAVAASLRVDEILPKLEEAKGTSKDSIAQLIAARQAERVHVEQSTRVDVAQRDVNVTRIFKRVIGRFAAGERDRANSALNALEGTEKQIARSENLLKELLPEWNQKVSASAKRPQGYGEIDLPGLKNYWFPSSIAETASKMLKNEGAPRGRNTWYLRLANTLNSMYRALNATADNSALAIQGLVGMAADPAAGKAALAVNFRAWLIGGEDALGKFIVDFDGAAQEAGRLSSDEWTRFRLHIGGGDTEMMIGAPGTYVENLARVPGFRQANRAFGFFGDTLRLKWADDLLADEIRRGRTINEIAESGDMQRIADAANAMTGWSGEQAFSSMGDLLFFAPRFLQSRLNTVAKAAMSFRAGATLDQRIARRSVLQMIGYAVGLTYMLNTMQGRDTDFSPMRRRTDGSWYYNPNFMRIRFGDRDFSLLGPWDSLARAIAKTVYDPSVGRPAPDQAMRGMGSGLVKVVWDLTSGEDFVGERVRDNPEDFGRWLAEAMTPFVFQDMPETISGIGRGLDEGDISDVVIGGTSLVGEFIGAKSSPLSFTDIADDIAREQGYANYNELEPHMRNEIRMLEEVEAVSERRAKTPYFARLGEIEQEFDDAMQFLVDNAGKNYQGQLIDESYIRRQYYSATRQRAIRKEEAARNFGIEDEIPDANETDANKAALDRYYQLSSDATIGPGGIGGFSYDVREQLLEEFYNTLSTAQKEYILRNTNIREIPDAVFNALSRGTRMRIKKSKLAREAYKKREAARRRTAKVY